MRSPWLSLESASPETALNHSNVSACPSPLPKTSSHQELRLDLTWGNFLPRGFFEMRFNSYMRPVSKLNLRRKKITL